MYHGLSVHLCPLGRDPDNPSIKVLVKSDSPCEGHQFMSFTIIVKTCWAKREGGELEHHKTVVTSLSLGGWGCEGRRLTGL